MAQRHRRALVPAVVLMVATGACSAGAPPRASRRTTPTAAASVSSAPLAPASVPGSDAPVPTSPPEAAPTAPAPAQVLAPVVQAPESPATAAAPDPEPVVVRYRIERRTTDVATEDFEPVVEATLSDPRGWSRAGFQLVRDPAALYTVVLAEGPVVDALCLPYDTYGRYSCQNGPVVALNADRWRTAHPKWTGDLPSFRQMLVNHEVGHLLGQHHPAAQCPRVGRPAPVMAQQTTELDGCLPNPWPLEWEVERAARHDLRLAPPFEPRRSNRDATR